MLDGNVKLCFTDGMSAIERAIEVVGGQAKLAVELGISPQAVSQWVKGRRPIPPGKCIAIEKASGGRVTRNDLRPDVFGASEAGVAA
jgi:DNA-binding transcriptional regulator YdaS (Cro superfamily)